MLRVEVESGFGFSRAPEFGVSEEPPPTPKV